MDILERSESWTEVLEVLQCSGKRVRSVWIYLSLSVLRHCLLIGRVLGWYCRLEGAISMDGTRRLLMISSVTCSWTCVILFGPSSVKGWS
jgi:hypothetical protein